MLEYNEINENGERIICEMGKKHADMLMTIKVKQFKENETITVFDDMCETAFLLLKGEAEITWQGTTEKIKRSCPFEKTPYCLHVPRRVEVTVTAKEGTEILIQQTDNDKDFAPVFYKPEDILYQEFGKGQWGGTGHRICSTVFDHLPG